MKLKISLIVATVIGSVLFIGGCLYFVAGVSATIPPIEIFECQGDFNQLISKMETFCSAHHNMKFEVTDRVGNQQNGYAVYANIYLVVDRDSMEYDLKFEDNSSKPNNSMISIVEAYNKTRNIVAYGKEAKQIKPLLNDFESKFLIPLQENQKIELIPVAPKKHWW
ncbi:MAG: hypothetical protein ACHQHN_05775 [Sphingobacteriales bacterium]